MVADKSTSGQTDEEQRYEAAWQYIRKWETRLIGVLLICPVIVGFDFLFPGKIYGAQAIGLAIIVGVTAVAVFVRPSCPRCGKEFFKLGFAKDGTWKNKCVHCGLPKGAPRDPDRHTSENSSENQSRKD